MEGYDTHVLSLAKKNLLEQGVWFVQHKTVEAPV
jgi:hypothetical protein